MLTGRKLALTLAFTVLVALAFGVSCKGFFVTPTVTAITIGPTGETIGPGGTLQFVASGTMSDGSPNQIVTNQCYWSATNGQAGAIGTNNGLFTAVSASELTNPPQQATVTAAYQALTPATATVSVCPSVTSLTIGASPTSYTLTQGTTITFTATADFATGGGSTNVISEVTWTISNTSIVPSIPSTGVVVIPGTGSGTAGSAIITATLCGVSSGNSVTITAQ